MGTLHYHISSPLEQNSGKKNTNQSILHHMFVQALKRAVISGCGPAPALPRGLAGGPGRGVPGLSDLEGGGL